MSSVPFVWSISTLGKGFLTTSDTNQKHAGTTLLYDIATKCGRMQKSLRWIWRRQRATPSPKPVAREGTMLRPPLCNWWAHCSLFCLLATIVPIIPLGRDIVTFSSRDVLFRSYVILSRGLWLSCMNSACMHGLLDQPWSKPRKQNSVYIYIHML